MQLPRGMPSQPQRLAGEHVAQGKRGVAAVAALGIRSKPLQLPGPGKRILAVQFGQLAVHMHHRHPLPTIQPVPERQHVVGGAVLVSGRFWPRGQPADVVLVKPRTDRLSDPVGPVDLAPHQPHPPAFLALARIPVTEERRAAPEMIQRAGSRKVPANRLGAGHRVHQPMGVATPGLVVLRMTTLATIWTTVVGRMHVAGGLIGGHHGGARQVIRCLGPPTNQTSLPDRARRNILSFPASLGRPVPSRIRTREPPATEHRDQGQSEHHHHSRPAATHALHSHTPPRPGHSSPVAFSSPPSPPCFSHSPRIRTSGCFRSSRVM